MRILRSIATGKPRALPVTDVRHEKEIAMSEDEDSEKMCDECFSAIGQGANHFSWYSRSLESLPSAKELRRRSLIDTT